jgi:hypothetical protein
MFTDVGLRLQVGWSFTPVIDIVTMQSRLTVPLNPLVPTTLMVPVFPVVAPGDTVMAVAAPVPGFYYRRESNCDIGCESC